MHITKQSPEMNKMLKLLFISSVMSTSSAITFADESHQMTEMDHSAHQMTSMNESSAIIDHSKHQAVKAAPTDAVHHAHDHRREHGGQLYQATTLENAWTLDEHGRGRASTELKTWVGTDENKIFIKAHVEKAESEKADTETMALYSRNIADFWDVQAGVRYQYMPEQSLDKNQWSAVFGLHGLAPYFFETEAYLYAGQDQRWQLSLDTSRDFLFTQKLIAQPYLQADLVLSDKSKYAQKTGLSKLQAGVQTRYEINKKIMPFIDIAYAYHKGADKTLWQEGSDSEKGWLYGAGFTLKF